MITVARVAGPPVDWTGSASGVVGVLFHVFFVLAGWGYHLRRRPPPRLGPSMCNHAPPPRPCCARVASESIVDVVAVLIFVMFMLIVAIVYLNLLVAMMTSGYTEVRKGHREIKTYSPYFFFGELETFDRK